MDVTLYNRVYTAELIKISSNEGNDFFDALKKIDILECIDQKEYQVNNRTIFLKKYYLQHNNSFYRASTKIPKSLLKGKTYLYDIYICSFGDYVFISAPFKGVAEFFFNYLDTFLKIGTGGIFWEYTKIKSNPFLLALGEKAQLKITSSNIYFYLTYCKLEYIFLSSIRTIKQNIQLQCKELGKSPQYQSLIFEMQNLNNEHTFINDGPKVVDIKLLSLKFKCRVDGFAYITCFTDRFGNFKYRIGKNTNGIINLMACLVNLYEKTDLDAMISNLPIHSINSDVDNSELLEK